MDFYIFNSLRFFNFCRLVPENIPWKHSCEGPDDMPAHAKACLLGSNLTLPICDGRVTLGTWQGVWLCEHRYKNLQQRSLMLDAFQPALPLKERFFLLKLNVLCMYVNARICAMTCIRHLVSIGQDNGPSAKDS